MKDSVKDFGSIPAPLVGSRREKRVGSLAASLARGTLGFPNGENHLEISHSTASSRVISMRKNDASNN